MHVFGFPLDLYLYLQILVTVLLIGVGLLQLLKSTASKYFMVDANFDSPEPALPEANANKIAESAALGRESCCVVCGQSTTKQCAGCKLVRYCSAACQLSHWNSGHKKKCKSLKTSCKEDLLSSSRSCNSTIGAATIVANGNTDIVTQAKQVLFPHNEFLELFNWKQTGFFPCGLLNCGNSVVTVLLIGVGLLQLLKSTASKYFMVDANFDSPEPALPEANANKIAESAALGRKSCCVVCGQSTTKQCAGCKLVRYCSAACQLSHWNSGHKKKCMSLKTSCKEDLLSSSRRSNSTIGPQGHGRVIGMGLEVRPTNFREDHRGSQSHRESTRLQNEALVLQVSDLRNELQTQQAESSQRIQNLETQLQTQHAESSQRQEEYSQRIQNLEAQLALIISRLPPPPPPQ